MHELTMNNVSAAGASDAAAIAALEKTCFSCPYSEGAIADMLTSSLYLSLILRDENGTVLGYLLGQAIPPEGDLLRVAVHPDARRRGGGRALIEAFLAQLRLIGCTVCYLDVRAHNLGAQALYAAYGFTPLDRRKNYYHLPTEDAIVMRLSLDEKE